MPLLLGAGQTRLQRVDRGQCPSIDRCRGLLCGVLVALVPPGLRLHSHREERPRRLSCEPPRRLPVCVESSGAG